PWGVNSAYEGDMQAYFSEAGNRRGAAERELQRPAGEPSAAELTAIGPLLAQARQQWPRGAASIQISNPNTQRAQIELRERGGNSLIERGRGQQMRFDGVTGTTLEMPATPPTSVTNAVYNVFSN